MDPKNLVIRSIRDFNLTGRSVFLRLDFNVPLAAGPNGLMIVTDDARIQEALPTIRFALEKNAKVVIGSHLGRPDGKVSPEFSLEPVASHLAGLLNADVTLADDCVGEGITLLVKGMKNGSVLVLENLRFHAEEEKNDHEFAQQLANLCEIYINDAFGTAHRKHASTHGMAQICQERGMGFLIEKELKFLQPLVASPEKPFYAVLGGSKVSDKIKTIEALLRSVNGICIGGAMAHAFWKVLGTPIPEGAKMPKAEDVEAAASILKEAGRREIPILVPVDTNLGFDIGPKTIEAFGKFLENGKTIFWNGPLGWFEKPEYSAGTFQLAEKIGALKAVKIVGGGDTVSAIKLSGHAEKFDHLSTGGGAVLEFIENGTLPGIEILKNQYRRETSQSMTREKILK